MAPTTSACGKKPGRCASSWGAATNRRPTDRLDRRPHGPARSTVPVEAPLRSQAHHDVGCRRPRSPSGRRKGDPPDAMLELLHGRMFLLASPRGSLGGDDDPALEAFVQVPAKHDVKLFLGEADNGGHVFALLAIAAVEPSFRSRVLRIHSRSVTSSSSGGVGN